MHGQRQDSARGSRSRFLLSPCCSLGTNSGTWGWRFSASPRRPSSFRCESPIGLELAPRDCSPDCGTDRASRRALLSSPCSGSVGRHRRPGGVAGSGVDRRAFERRLLGDRSHPELTRRWLGTPQQVDGAALVPRAGADQQPAGEFELAACDPRLCLRARIRLECILKMSDGVFLLA